MEKGCNKKPKMEREIPDNIIDVHGVPRPSPRTFRLSEPINHLLYLNQFKVNFSHPRNQKASNYHTSFMWGLQKTVYIYIHAQKLHVNVMDI